MKQDTTECIDLSGLNLKSLLNYSIWKQLKIGHLHNISLNKVQQSEVYYLNEHIREYIFNASKHNSTNNRFIKSSQGYTLRRICPSYYAKNCRSSWTLKIDILSSHSQLSHNVICNHTVESLPNKGVCIYIIFIIFFILFI